MVETVRITLAVDGAPIASQTHMTKTLDLSQWQSIIVRLDPDVRDFIVREHSILTVTFDKGAPRD